MGCRGAAEGVDVEGLVVFAVAVCAVEFGLGVPDAGAVYLAVVFLVVPEESWTAFTLGVLCEGPGLGVFDLGALDLAPGFGF